AEHHFLFLEIGSENALRRPVRMAVGKSSHRALVANRTLKCHRWSVYQMSSAQRHVKILYKSRMDALRQPVQFFHGVGPKRAKLLEHLGLSTVADLLGSYPRSWEDRKESPSRGSEGGLTVVRARVVRSRTIPTRAHLALFKATLHVPAWSGTVEAVWFKRLNH